MNLNVSLGDLILLFTIVASFAGRYQIWKHDRKKFHKHIDEDHPVWENRHQMELTAVENRVEDKIEVRIKKHEMEKHLV